MYILGIVEGHNCSAALLKDGELVAVCFEERFSRLKNDLGYPSRAIQYCLESQGIVPEDLGHVAMVTENLPVGQVLTKREATFSMEDYYREQEEYWYPVLYEGKQVNYLEVFKDKIRWEDFPYEFSKRDLARKSFREFKKIRIDTVKHRLKKRDDQIRILNHHYAHSMYAIYTAPFCYKRDVLVLAADGYGDDCSASVGTYENGKFKFVSKSTGSGIGRVYRYATLLLGMKQGVDEYKVMGLAPYAKEYHWEKAYEQFRNYLKVEGMEIKFTNPDKDLFFP